MYTFSSNRRSAEVLKEFFEETFILSQNLFSDEDRYEKILEMIPDECKLDCFVIDISPLWWNNLYTSSLITPAAIASELRGKWQDKKRSREDINVSRWGQLKHLLQSGKQKV